MSTYVHPLAKIAANRKARYARRDRARRIEILAAWGQLTAGFVAALVILVPVAIMIGTNLTWHSFGG